MKIQKVLLGAILAGITVQSVSSCDKRAQDKTKPAVAQPGTDAMHPTPNPDPSTEPCPACGMG